MSAMTRRLLVVFAVLGSLLSSGLPSAASISGEPAGLTMIEPCVALDTRAGTGEFAGPLQAGPSNGMTFDPSGAAGFSEQGGSICGIPFGTNLSAVVLSVEAVDVTTAGNLRVFAPGEPAGGGVVNYGVPGSENSNVVIVPVRELDDTVRVEANVGAVEVVITVIGYFEPGTGSGYTPVTPCTVADSRFGTGSFAGPYVGDSVKSIQIASATPLAQGGTTPSCDVPPGTDGVLLNVVAVNPVGDGTVGVRAAGASSSAIYVHYDVFDPAMNNAAAVFVPLSATGRVELFTDAPAGASTHVRAVVLGYFDSATGTNEYLPVNSCAAFDSRTGQGASGSFAGPYLGGESRTVQITGTFPAAQGGGATTCGVPAGARAVHLNLVAVNPLVAGNLRVAAAGETPTGGVLNFAPIGTNNSNAVVVPLDADGRLDVSANAGPLGAVATSEVRGVVLGYFIDVDQEIEAHLLGPLPPTPQTSVLTPFTITGAAYDDASVVSVTVSITDQVTGAELIPVAYGSGVDWSGDTSHRFDTDLTSPGAVSTNFSFGPLDLEAIGGSGSYSVLARATDDLGNTHDDLLTIRTRVSPGPVVEMKTPVDGASVGLPVVIAGSANDPQGLSSGTAFIRDTGSGLYLRQELTGSLSFAVGPSPIRLLTSGSHWWASLDSTILLGRSLVVEELFLNDGAGNSSTTAGHGFDVDGDIVAPMLTMTTPTNGATVAAPLKLSGAASDDAGVTRVSVLISNATTEQFWNGTGYQSSEIWLDADLGSQTYFPEVEWGYGASAGLGTGTFKIQVRAVDPPGNVVTTSTVVITIA